MLLSSRAGNRGSILRGVTKFSLFKKLLCSLLLAQIGQGGWVMNE